MRVLVVEDYAPLRDSVVECLRESGYAVDHTAAGDEGLWYAENFDHDIIILDIMLPKVDGLTILRRMRAQKRSTPIIMISALDAVSQRVIGLDSGADDYLIKPFALEELLSRIRALIRRRHTEGSPILEIGDLLIDIAKKHVTRANVTIHLTAREYALLEYLALHANKVVSRTEISEHVYQDFEGGISNNIDVYIGYLRKKLNHGGLSNIIKTHRGIGYSLISLHRKQ